MSLHDFLKDFDVQDVVLRNIQLAIQGCIGIGSHTISDQDWEHPDDLSEIFTVLKNHRVITKETAKVMVSVVGFRNIIVHEYCSIDLEKVYDVFRSSLGDIERFCLEIATYLGYNRRQK
ncbi:MAG TPA: type VII toxin-antitoxin system HepT family RNase toxin [Candidatus Brocadiia bacterium]